MNLHNLRTVANDALKSASVYNGAISTPTRTFVSCFTKRRCLRFQRTFATSPVIRRDDAPKTKIGGTDYAERVRSLSEDGDLARWYPRLGRSHTKERSLEPFELVNDFADRLSPGDIYRDEVVQVAGRVKARRTAGSKLVFFDIEASSVHGTPVSVQIVCNQGVVKEIHAEAPIDVHNQSVNGGPPLAESGVKSTGPVEKEIGAETFKTTCQRIRVGDLIAIRGHPHRTKAGQLSILATHLPVLHAPMLHQLPDQGAEAEAVNRRFHVKLLLQPRVKEVLRLRMLIEDELDDHCKGQGMTRVRTPIIGASSGGAAADPFETRAKELTDDNLTLRIAPELYLKRLIVGDMYGVYEIGPSFRNEGVDATHNPEFTTCEYYQRHATVPKLMRDTEDFLQTLNKKVRIWAQAARVSLDPPILDFTHPFTILDFIPYLETVIRSTLEDSNFTIPDLERPDAVRVLHELYPRMGVPIPPNPTLPRILDDLSGRYIEPACTKPTWIVNQPACLAPLAKSYVDERTGQHVSARAELFIAQREYVNCYEEENSPFEQRKKFLQQRLLQGGEAAGQADSKSTGAGAEPATALPGIEESYIEALEWGLPPTGGWGCGVDRLVMLFAGVDRIADVLPFGTLRNVAAMGKPLRR